MSLLLIINALGLVFLAFLIPGPEVTSLYIAVISAVILGLLNAVIKPIAQLNRRSSAHWFSDTSKSS